MIKLSENTFKWLMRFYPPLFFQRIWVKKFHKDFMGVDVRIVKSIWNMNSNKTIFGGTMFAATDPFFPLLFEQVLYRNGFKKMVVWLKSAQIQFIKPGKTSLDIHFRIDHENIIEAIKTLKSQGKFTQIFHIELIDQNGVVCAVAQHEVYVKDLDFS